MKTAKLLNLKNMKESPCKCRGHHNLEELCMKPYIVGIWKADPCKMPQGYEFGTWGEALDFYKRNRKDFTIWYHFLMPDVLPF